MSTAPGPDEVVDTLAGLTLFADLSRPEIEAVAHTFEEEWIGEGQRVLRQGFAGSGFYLILEGEASVQVDGREVTRLARGDFFGEVSVLLGEKPTADVVALRSLRCLVLAGPELRGFLLAYPHVCYRMLQAEANKLRKTSQ